MPTAIPNLQFGSVVHQNQHIQSRFLSIQFLRTKKKTILLCKITDENKRHRASYEIWQMAYDMPAR